jgi:hypothetical protein
LYAESISAFLSAEFKNAEVKFRELQIKKPWYSYIKALIVSAAPLYKNPEAVPDRSEIRF